MATTTLNTRIQLKYDTYENWTTNNPVLLAGEVAVTTVQSAQAPVSQVPAILFKVGDGTNNFNALNWASAIAADVYPWAKASVKPTYQASEIEGLEDYISGQIEDTDTQYQIIASGTNGIQLQSRPKTGGAWTNVGSPITITYTLAEGSANGTVAFNGVDVPVHGLGTAAYEASTAFDVAGAAAGVQTTVTGTSSDASTAITIYGTRKYAAEQATAAQTAATSAAKSYTDGQITQAKTDLIGTGDATSTTIKGAVAESKTYADTQIAANGAGVPSTEGVPTDYLLSPAGWVAPPSGGNENWELIIDHVVPETVASVLIDQDLNGEAFSLKKWALLTIWLPDENVSTQERCRVGFHPSTRWGVGSIYETAKAPTNAETASSTLAFCSFTNGLIKLDDVYYVPNAKNMGYSMFRQYQGINQSGGIDIDPSTKEIVSTYRDSYATCVKINTISSTSVRKGSVIRLWGVRA